MRARIYGSLSVLALATGGMVLATSAKDDDCYIVCAWQIPLLVIGVASSLAFLGVAGLAIAYEIVHLLRRRNG